MGVVRKNAADIKMAVDAIELSLRARLHHDVRARHRRQRLHAARPQAARAEPARHRHRRRGVDVGAAAARVRRVPLLRAARGRRAERAAPSARTDARQRSQRRRPTPAEPSRAPSRRSVAPAGGDRPRRRSSPRRSPGSSRSSGGPVLASMLKRAILRKDPTFSEADLRVPRLRRAAAHLAERGVVEVHQGTRAGRPRGHASRPQAGDEDAAFALLRDDGRASSRRRGRSHLSGLKNQLRKQQPDFSEKRFGYGGFLQFVQGGRAPRASSRWSATPTPTTTSCAREPATPAS